MHTFTPSPIETMLGPTAAASPMPNPGPGSHDDSTLSQNSPPLPRPRVCSSHRRQPPQRQHRHQLVQSPPQAQPQLPSRSVKRPRPVKSCTECRKRKLRCDRLCPCSQCQKTGRPCKYAAEHDASHLSDASDLDHVEPVRSSKRSCRPAAAAAAATAATAKEATPAGNGMLPSLPRLEELTLRMERLEKKVRGRGPDTSLAGERCIAAPPETIRGLSVKRGLTATRLFGQNSSRVMLNLFEQAKTFMPQQPGICRDLGVFSAFRALHKCLQDRYRKDMAPITVFVDSMMPVLKRMTDILPSKPVCDRLLASYLDTSETIYRTIHLPTFSEQYELYWQGKLHSDSFLPQLLSVLSIASRFGTKSKGLGRERVEGIHIPTACALVRSWLDGLKGKQLIEMTTLQAEVLLLQAQSMITPRAEDSWTQLGFVIRLAMTMGLHRDASEFDGRISVFLGEIRRRLWFTIVDMDLHLSLACNLPCLIREGDFSCRPPRNLDDADLFPAMRELPPAKPIDQVTDNRLQTYAAMTLAARMRVASLIKRVDGMCDYLEVMEVGAKLERFLDDINHIFPRHGVLDDGQRSRQWRWRLILEMHVRRPLLALYRPLAMGVADAPIQVTRAYLRSSVVLLEYLDELDPLSAHFRGVAEMYHQHLKRDIIQAALSVCFFVQSVVGPRGAEEEEGFPGPGQQQTALRMSPDSVDDYASDRAEKLMLWSPSRLVGTVQKTLDLLIGNMGGGDTKDIVCLAIVLETARTTKAKAHEMSLGLQGVLEACLRASNLTREELRMQMMEGQRPAPYTSSRAPYAYPGGDGRSGMGVAAAGTVAPDGDAGGWTMWDGWD